jgi:hypothetical protein
VGEMVPHGPPCARQAATAARAHRVDAPVIMAGREVTFPPPGAPPTELFTTDQLVAHAARIAAPHTLATDPRRARRLLPRLDRSGKRLDEAYLFLASASRDDPQPPGSEEWLRDNHHVVQDQVREVQQHLPLKFYLELPKLADGLFGGYPRVYLLARELIAHTAGRIDLDTIVDFTVAYQRSPPLTSGRLPRCRPTEGSDTSRDTGARDVKPRRPIRGRAGSLSHRAIRGPGGRRSGAVRRKGSGRSPSGSRTRCAGRQLSPPSPCFGRAGVRAWSRSPHSRGT